jgi:hypothetical protein
MACRTGFKTFNRIEGGGGVKSSTAGIYVNILRIKSITPAKRFSRRENFEISFKA